MILSVWGHSGPGVGPLCFVLIAVLPPAFDQARESGRIITRELSCLVCSGPRRLGTFCDFGTLSKVPAPGVPPLVLVDVL